MRARTKPTFSLCDLKRAVSGFQKMNLPVTGAEIRPDGSIVILTGVEKASPISTDPYEQWKADQERRRDKRA